MAAIIENDKDQLEDQLENQVAEMLRSMSSETVEDLMQLFALLPKETDENEKTEIVKTIREILFPQSMIVTVSKEFGFQNEDPAVRARLQDYRRHLGVRVKELRKERGWSQEDLADRAGMSQSHVCRLETGQHVPEHKTIEKLALAFGVPVSAVDPGCNDD